MRFLFHGGAREVGRSCIELVGEKNRVLLDAGLKIGEHDSEFPVGIIDPKGIDAVFISHAHLDHTGALPLLDHQGMDCPIFMTSATKDLTRLILKDAFKVGKINHQHLGYDEADIKQVLHCTTKARVDQKGEFKGISYEFFDAGHIPGSSLILIEMDGKKVLYTGDFNTIDTNLLFRCEDSFGDVDFLICESTYGDKEHPNRDAVEREFMMNITSVMQRGGTCLIPVFAVGRAQEILMVLGKYRFKGPVFIEGMGVEATDIILSNESDIRDSEALHAFLKKVKIVKGPKDRSEALRKPSVVITTSGMLTGGPVLNYLKSIAPMEKHAILLTGYQGEHTNGRLLLEKREVFIDGLKRSVKAEVKQYDFSAHAGNSGLKSFVRKLSPKTVFFVHGEERSVSAMQEWAEAIGLDAVVPLNGDGFTR